MQEELPGVKTDDMGLAAYLRLMGHTPEACYWEDDLQTCYWLFGEEAEEDARLFINDTASVSPREYNRAFAQAKREFWNKKKEKMDELGISR